MGFGVKDKTPILTIGDIRDTNKDKEKFTEHALSTSVFGWLFPVFRQSYVYRIGVGPRFSLCVSEAFVSSGK